MPLLNLKRYKKLQKVILKKLKIILKMSKNKKLISQPNYRHKFKKNKTRTKNWKTQSMLPKKTLNQPVSSHKLKLTNLQKISKKLKLKMEKKLKNSKKVRPRKKWNFKMKLLRPRQKNYEN